ncbi:very short patch repair endonuclease [Planctomonas deserti]|uniref:very short patch repair endonuclease n=1 Tax=Planctomonas deserti TaxID=2144185 RepID=UPI000D380E4A|nr:very short patch repair endonuclease [Planctomonas deserti]
MATERPSRAASEGVRRSMQSNKGRDTKPELAVRRLLHAAGVRYRVNYRPIPRLRRTADIVFTRANVAVFIDGCFWHGCPEHYQRPAANRDFWDSKVTQNATRDLETTRRLEAEGWVVLRFWEHESAADVARAILERVRP